MNLAPTSSTTAALAMGDALAMALLDLRGLRPEDFAALHPRGALGWRTLFRVGDLMHTGTEIPIVTVDTSMAEVIREITRKRLGITTVVDREGRLIGVITDGDLRRAHLRPEPIVSLQAAQVASANPKTVDAGDLAVKALEIMETFAITSVVIVDAERRPAGILHMHDVLRAKIDV
jgi:arabinose-5-phosphate isomerase